MGLAAHDGADRADQLLGVTERLTELVQDEISDLNKGQLDASSKNWNEKEKLAHAYRLEMSEIKKNPTLLEGATDEQKKALMQSVEIFQSVLSTHSEAIIGMKEVAEGLVRAVTREVAETRAAPAGYSATGLVSKPRDASGSGLAANVKV